MAEARQRDEWARASSLMALIANANRDAKKHRAYRPTDFDPFTVTAKAKQKVDVSILKEVFIDTPPRPPQRQQPKRRKAHT